jgi:hypothetical protein
VLDACVAHEKKPGRMLLQWEISALGDVTYADIRSDWPFDSAARACVLSLVRTWKFPKQQGMVMIEFAWNA